jgi:hypothetical protein
MLVTVYPRLSFSNRLVTVQVGNGGFSLRRIKACLSLFREFPETRNKFLTGAEDFFFAAAGSVSLHFRIPNERVASTFALEVLPEMYFKANGGRCLFSGFLHQIKIQRQNLTFACVALRGV